VPCNLKGDPSRLRQILVNLVGNAIKFTERGAVAIEACLGESPSAGRRLRVGVRDTGIGIPQHRRAGPFRSVTPTAGRTTPGDGRTARRYGGTGLGLTISRQLAQIMGGDIVVESVVGEGSTFWVDLPLEQSTAPVRVRTSAPASLKGTRILIVDDHPVNLRALAGQLRGWGMVPVEAESGARALAVLREDAGTRAVALAILDMQMPQMDGEETAVAIHAMAGFERLPLVLLSSTGSRFATPQEMQQKGFVAALVKPVRAARLFSTVAEVL